MAKRVGLPSVGDVRGRATVGRASNGAQGRRFGAGGCNAAAGGSRAPPSSRPEASARATGQCSVGSRGRLTAMGQRRAALSHSSQSAAGEPVASADRGAQRLDFAARLAAQTPGAPSGGSASRRQTQGPVQTTLLQRLTMQAAARARADVLPCASAWACGSRPAGSTVPAQAAASRPRHGRGLATPAIRHCPLRA